MVYYLIKNNNGFEELMLEGTKEEAEAEKARCESALSATSKDETTWQPVKYYVLPETEWRMEIGCIH